jgi:hypothetical protein
VNPTKLSTKELIDRISKVLPRDVAADFYREMMYCCSLPENDEMLRILRILQILTAQGDKLLITANRRGNGFRCTNGEIVTVSSIDRERRITLTDGRVLPFDFKRFTHGYAVTAHRSQGKSVDEVIISGDGMRKELFYVAASRGRESLQIITSDKELLRESVGLSNARQSASELERKSRPGLHQGVHRGLALARSLARRAAQFISQLGKPLTLTRESPHQPIVENSHDWGIE